MGTIHPPAGVKLFVGLLLAAGQEGAAVEQLLCERWGAIDIRSPLVPFDFTDYYRGEMGERITRYWVSFERQIAPGELAAIKAETNRLEERFADRGRRRVNLDPGYLTLANVVLASTKDFSHRIFLAGGIYGEVTLVYRGGRFVPLEWTYPDYRSDTAAAFLSAARETLSAAKKKPPFRRQDAGR